jgi:glucose-6-phosphate isomerase
MDSMERLMDVNAITRLKERDPQLFSDDVDSRQKIMQRLGWTDLAETASGRLPLVTSLANAVRDEGGTDVVLLGMGGSSLAPLVLERVIGCRDDMPRFHVVDTTCPTTVVRLMNELDRATTYFVVSSKSGTTIEPMSLYSIFRFWMEEELERPAAGKHFIVVTDPGTPLEKMRQKEVMRVALSAPATVGGRFSALSMFGLAPAALMGIDLETLVASAQEMETACHQAAEDNPAAELAAWMGDAYEAGRDKLTLVCSPEYRAFGLWVEQLVAESTGKEGVGLVPVIEYSPSTPSGYGEDRMVVVLRRSDDHDLESFATQVSAEQPTMEYLLDDPLGIGAEFVRWEHAVALVGVLLGINPFDEPNVAEAKATTMQVLEGEAQVPPAIADLADVWVTYAGGFGGHRAPESLAEAVSPLAAELAEGDYVAVLTYLDTNDELFGPLADAVSSLSKATGHAVCLEVGPRYLHSTGQLHKGGPNTGVFLVITARDRVDTAIPGQDFSLAHLFRSQAEGDLTTLAAHDHRVMRLDLPETSPAGVAAVARAIAEAAG